MTFLFLLLVVGTQANVRPAIATVGDPIEIRLTVSPQASVTVDASETFEVVSAKGAILTVRAFAPGEVAVSGTVHEPGAETRFRVVVKVRSVLKPGDKLEPAPLRPPREIATSKLPWKMIGGAAAVAAIAWGLLLWATRRRADVARGVTRAGAAAEFRAAVLAIRRLPPADENIAALGDAVRGFFSRIERRLGRDLTTTEVIAKLSEEGVDGNTLGIVREILNEADLAKFSPWGPHQHDSPALADRALEIAELKRDEGAA